MPVWFFCSRKGLGISLKFILDWCEAFQRAYNIQPESSLSAISEMQRLLETVRRGTFLMQWTAFADGAGCTISVWSILQRTRGSWGPRRHFCGWSSLQLN